MGENQCKMAAVSKKLFDFEVPNAKCLSALHRNNKNTPNTTQMVPAIQGSSSVAVFEKLFKCFGVDIFSSKPESQIFFLGEDF